jgi:NAD(P)-dependent dehydrogenase (short-subunit alcohol dehydrogenase family)
MSQPTAIVVGVGAEKGVGAAVARRFAREGYHVFAAGRTQAKLDAVVASIAKAGGSAEGVVTDATNEVAVIALFDHAFAARDGKAAPDVVVFNAGDNRRIAFREADAALFEAFWRVGCFAGFLVGREAARRLVPLGRGTVVFTGASGSLRGKDGFAQFAAAKAGLRMISQSMAREFGPQGIHVAHVVIDGGIDGDRLNTAAPGLAGARGENGMLQVDPIAEAYWQLHRQHPSAWTQELDLRPFKEPF